MLVLWLIHQFLFSLNNYKTYHFSGPNDIVKWVALFNQHYKTQGIFSYIIFEINQICIALAWKQVRNLLFRC